MHYLLCTRKTSNGLISRNEGTNGNTFAVWKTQILFSLGELQDQLAASRVSVLWPYVPRCMTGSVCMSFVVHLSYARSIPFPFSEFLSIRQLDHHNMLRFSVSSLLITDHLRSKRDELLIVCNYHVSLLFLLIASSFYLILLQGHLIHRYS